MLADRPTRESIHVSPAVVKCCQLYRTAHEFSADGSQTTECGNAGVDVDLLGLHLRNTR